MITIFDVETTGLRPYNSIVTLIGLKREGKIKQWKLWEIQNEAEMIIQAIDVISKINDSIIGFNNLKFDVPFMLERLKILDKWKEKYYEIYSKKWLDIYQYIGDDYRSMTIWLNKAGIIRDYPALDGREIPIYYEKGQYDKIEQRNIDDINTAEKLFKYLKEQNQELFKSK